jgi:carboxyl-terminal processing protease
MIKRFSMALLSIVLSLSACEAAMAQASETAKVKDAEFNAPSAWEEFESTFRLFYAYLDKRQIEAEEWFSITKKSALKTQSPDAFRDVVRRASYLFTDPHIIVGPLTPEDYNVFPTASDLIARKDADRFIIDHVRLGSPAAKAGILPGWEVKSIDGLSPDTVLSNIMSGLPFSLSQEQESYLITLALNGRRSGERNLEFLGAETTHKLSLLSPREFAVELSRKPALSTEVIENFAVIKVNNSLGDNDLIALFDEAIINARGKDGLILDLRNTPSGGNTEVGRSLIGHFVSEERPYQIHEIPSLEREFSVPRKFIELVQPRAPYLPAENVGVLSGPWTGSMGEGITIGLDGAAGVTVIASDMGDLLGGLSNRYLERSGMNLDLGTEYLTHIDGTPREDFIADISPNRVDVGQNGQDIGLALAIKELKSR